MEESTSIPYNYRAVFDQCPVVVSLFDEYQAAVIYAHYTDDDTPYTSCLRVRKVSGVWCIENLNTQARWRFATIIAKKRKIPVHFYQIDDKFLYQEVDKVMNKIFSNLTVDLILG